MTDTAEKFYRGVNFVTVLTMAAIVTAIGYHIAKGGSIKYVAYVVPLLFGVAMIGMLIAFPKIPKLQVACAFVVIFFLHHIPEMFHLPPLIFIVEPIIDMVCVRWFGAHWVRKGYIPAAANH